MSSKQFPTDIKSKFPVLRNNSQIFLDGPAGTQVPDMVINRISNYLKTTMRIRMECFYRVSTQIKSYTNVEVTLLNS